MKNIDIDLMPDYSEIVPYRHTGIPFYIHTANLSNYPAMRAPCHWHNDIEWIHILDGKMYYNVNGNEIILNKNDTLMVNTRQMHYGYSYKKQECHFFNILFHPSLFFNNKSIQQKYFTPVLENSGMEYLHFNSMQKQGIEVEKLLKQIIHLHENAEEAYELEIIAVMYTLWGRLFRHNELVPENSTNHIHSDLDVQKEMVSFIYQHYAEKISLDDIAASGCVSRSKCCLIFKHYLQQSPIDFLNSYRLKISRNLLRNTNKSITEIAFSCGFNHLSYFSKMFINYYGCTPREYRKNKA